MDVALVTYFYWQSFVHVPENRYYLKLRKIHWKIPVLESLFSLKKGFQHKRIFQNFTDILFYRYSKVLHLLLKTHFQTSLLFLTLGEHLPTKNIHNLFKVKYKSSQGLHRVYFNFIVTPIHQKLISRLVSTFFHKI